GRRRDGAGPESEFAPVPPGRRRRAPARARGCCLAAHLRLHGRRGALARYAAQESFGLVGLQQSRKPLPGPRKESRGHAVLREGAPFRPGLSVGSVNQGVASSGLGRLDEARRYYEETLRMAPAFAAAHNNLANVYLRQGRIEQAIEHYE